VSPHQDKGLTCADCGGKFLWTAREQEWYAERGYQPPMVCKGCKQAQRRGPHRRDERK